MSEAQKYQGALYKNKKAKTGNSSTNNNSNNNQANAQRNMAHHAYVEDYVEDYVEHGDYEGGWEDITSVPPHVPSPPLPNHINVFDFQVSATPTASTVALPQIYGPTETEATERNAVVRFDDRAVFDDADMMADDEMISYGTGPVPVGFMAYDTPMPKARKSRPDKDGKKDKKRKRLHVATTHDLEMTDAPTLHSGLTGGLRRMMDPREFPPSPDYSGSGGDVAETPVSPLKKSRHSKHHRSSRQEGGIGNNLMSMLASVGGTSKSTSKTKKRKHTSAGAISSSKKRHSSKRLEGAKERKLLAYNENDGDEKKRSVSGAGAMIRYDRRADLFFSEVNKGPDSERGCSVNKVLKRFHRARGASGDALPKSLEEKELFKTLRMRRNDNGEIVLFCVE